MDEASNREIGRRIAALRAARGWSQGWLAPQAGMTQSVLSRVEAGKRETRASELEKLARALGVGPEILLEGVDAAPGAGTGAGADAGEPLASAPLDMNAPGPAADRSVFPAVAGCVSFDSFEEPLALRSDAASYGADLGALAREAAEHGEIDDEQPAREARRGSPDRGAWAPVRMARLRDESPAFADEPPGMAREASRRRARQGQVYGFTPRPPLPSVDLSTLPALVATVIADYLSLRPLSEEDMTIANASWDSIDAHGRRRPAGKPQGFVAGRPAAAVSWSEPRDRYARLWRHELGIGVDGPVPDLVSLFEDAGVAEVIVARLETDRPVCATVTVPGARGRSVEDVSFLFVNADRPVVLQRHALVHAFGHLALGHGDITDEAIGWSRAAPLEMEANDFAEEFLAPTEAVARWYDRHGDPRPSLDVLLDLAAAFGISFWAALYRSRAAGRLGEKPQARLTHELRARQWELLPEQSFRGGLRDTLSTLSQETPLPPPDAVGAGGVRPRLTREPPAEAAPAPVVLRVPARLRIWTLQALRSGRLSLDQATAVLRRSPADLPAELARLGLK